MLNTSDTTVSKAHIRACLILRAFMSRDIHLGYLSVHFCFTCALLLNTIQLFGHLIQLATSMPLNQFNVALLSDHRVPTLRNMSYNNLLRYMNVPSLELRRLHTRFVLVLQSCLQIGTCQLQ